MGAGMVRNRKGITAVIAIVLLLMMTVGAAGFAYIWVTDLQNRLQGSTTTSVEQMTAANNAKLGIDSMWNDTGSISINLRNSGSYAFPELGNFRIYVNGVPLDNTADVQNLGGAFAPKDVKTIKLITTAFPAPGMPKNIKILSDIEGVQVTYKCSISMSTETYC